MESKSNQSWARPFFTIWTGQAFSLLGSQLVQFALIWWLTQTTGSATVLAVASLAGLLPQVVLGPLTGALVDRWNRRLVMILADASIALATLLLALLFWSGQVQVWHVFFILFFRAAASGFHWPAMTASTSLMVPKEHLSRVQGFNQMLNGGMNIAAAPLGALLLGVLPMQGVLAIDILTALIAILPLTFIAVPQPERHINASEEALGAKPSVWQDLRAGLRYVWAWPGLVLILLMATLINLVLNPAFALLPILVTKYFGGQALQLAWTELSWGLGVVLGGLLLGVWGGFRRRIYTSLLGLVGVGIGSLAIGLLPPGALPYAIVVMFLLGVTNPITNGPLFAVLQDVVAPDMQGRVFSLIGAVASAMTPLGLIIAGPVADKYGAQSWFLVGGVLTLLMGLGSIFIPAITHLEDGRTADRPTEAEKPALAPVTGD